MANQFCPVSNPCPDASNPVSNYSAEANDVPIFIGRNFGHNQSQPPLGKTWFANSCVGRVRSTVSQEEANLQAARLNTLCLGDEWPEVTPDPDDPTTPVITPRVTFGNDPQACDYLCPDGSSFGYVVPEDTFLAFSQAAADAQAASYACSRALNLSICLGDLSASGLCTQDDFIATASIQILSENFPLTATMSAGALPPGIVLTHTASEITLSGNTASPGQYDFTIRVEDSQGNFNQKAFSLFVVEIANDSLASGTVGNAYSETLTTVGPTQGTVTWSVVSGALAPGLSLNAASGAITGTPTTAGTYNFTIAMTDER